MERLTSVKNVYGLSTPIHKIVVLRFFSSVNLVFCKFSWLITLSFLTLQESVDNMCLMLECLVDA